MEMFSQNEEWEEKKARIFAVEELSMLLMLLSNFSNTSAGKNSFKGLGVVRNMKTFKYNYMYIKVVSHWW